MGNSDYLITWPNLSKNVTAASSSPWTLSHRAAFGMKQPVVASTDAASSSAALFSYLPELSTTDPASPFTVITYLRPLFFASGLSASTFQPLQPIPTDFIYASGSKSPGNSAESTSFSYHDQVSAPSDNALMFEGTSLTVRECRHTPQYCSTLAPQSH